jgi:hypothetical protein
MKKTLVILITLLLGLSASAQFKLGAEFALGPNWKNSSMYQTGPDLLRSPALKAEIGMGQRWTLTTGLRYTSLRPAMAYGRYFCFVPPQYYEPATARTFLEVPVGMKYRINPHTNSQWSLSVSAGASVGKATDMTYSRVFLYNEELSYPTPKPWLVGAELGGEISRNLGRHLSLDFNLRLRAMTTFRKESIAAYQSLAPNGGLGMGWRF